MPIEQQQDTKKKQVVDKPDQEAEAMLDDVLENSVSYVSVRGHKWRVRWKRHRGLRRMSHILAKGEDDTKVICQCTAALRLDKWWRIKLFYWLVWRWYYYVRDYQPGELLPYIAECKKKVPVASYFACIMLLTGMRDTEMAMTKAEAGRIHLAQAMAQRGVSEKNTDG